MHGANNIYSMYNMLHTAQDKRSKVSHVLCFGQKSYRMFTDTAEKGKYSAFEYLTRRQQTSATKPANLTKYIDIMQNP